MGVEPYLASDAMVGVIAQRLVRRLCPACRKPHTADENEMMILNVDKPVTIYKSEGCPACQSTGYRGRTAIHEVMLIEKEHRNIITRGGSAEDIRDIAVKKGMVDLFESCKDLVLRGVTSIQEMVKTVYARD
jgi:type IV pilus assembly protein PilB